MVMRCAVVLLLLLPKAGWAEEILDPRDYEVKHPTVTPDMKVPLESLYRSEGDWRRTGSRQFQARAVASAEALRAKFLQAENESTEGRWPRDAKYLKKVQPGLKYDAPDGTQPDSFMWGEYVKYRERRLGELLEGLPVRGPLKYFAYVRMRASYAQGLAFERKMVALLMEDAARPRAERRWLKDFDQPRIETHVGLAKADLRFADVLVIEEGPSAGPRPRVETFTFKSRDLSRMKLTELTAQLAADAHDALMYNGETLRIRHPGMEMEAQVQRASLIYERSDQKPVAPAVWKEAAELVMGRLTGAELSLQ